MTPTTTENEMLVPDRPIESDPRFQAMWGDAPLCNKCDEELRDINDDGHKCLVCPICDLGEPKNNDTLFNLHFYGMTECSGFHNGLVSESRTEMYELQMWWEHNLHWKLSKMTSGIHKPGDVWDGNPAGQYFIWYRGNQIGCLTEVKNG